MTTLTTIVKQTSILLLFTLEAPEWSYVEIANAMKMNQSTITNQLNTACKLGWLMKVGRGRYRLGPLPFDFPPELRPINPGDDTIKADFPPHVMKQIQEAAQVMACTPTEWVQTQVYWALARPGGQSKTA